MLLIVVEKRTVAMEKIFPLLEPVFFLFQARISSRSINAVSRSLGDKSRQRVIT